jgi:hypothetical protein
MLLPADLLIRALFVRLSCATMQDDLLDDVDVCVFDSLPSGATVVQRELQ